MKLLLSVLGVFVLLAPVALADKTPEPKDWGYDLSGVREVVPEVEPNNACPGQEIVCDDLVQPASIDPLADHDWYTVWVEAGQEIMAGTDAYGSPEVGDSYMYLYDDDCVTQLAYDDDGGPGLYSLITYTATYTGYYNIMVKAYGDYYTGGYQLLVECNEPPIPPENDRCEGAIAIERCTEGVIEGDLRLAANDYDPGIPGPSCTGYSCAGRDVAYVMDLVAGDIVHLFYYGGYDESFYIVTDCANETATCLIGADETVGTGETIDWVAPATGTYYVICDAYGTNAGGMFDLTYEITCPVPAQESTWGQIKARFN